MGGDGKISGYMSQEEGKNTEPKNEGEEVQPETTSQSEGGEEIDVRDEIIEKLKGENDSLKDAMMRAMAEAQNIRRRVQEQMQTERKYAAEGLVRDLIPVLDNFARTMDAINKGANAEKIAEGVAQIEKLMMKALEGANVVRVKSVGEAFNPEMHEALTTLETDEFADDTVVDEIEAGYMIHDRVIRPARVRVSKKP